MKVRYEIERRNDLGGPIFEGTLEMTRADSMADFWNRATIALAQGYRIVLTEKKK